MTNDTIKRIAEGKFDWIKVKRFNEKELAHLSSEELYNALLAHHEKETTFLIKVCQELAIKLNLFIETEMPNETRTNG